MFETSTPRLARPLQLWRALLSVTLLLLLVAALGGCSALPARGEPGVSTAFSDTQDSRLARIVAASRPAGETALSGFRLLPTGEFAFDARISLARQAERSLDLQVYHLQADQAGHALLRELRDAAARGVRVRLLVDDLHAAEIHGLLADLASHANVAVRLFNPLPMKSGAPMLRLLLSRGEFERHNHRMHNKLYIADNAVAVYGGRNVADEYFMGHRESNFVDLDLLSTGALVGQLSAVFDRYWNSDAAWPVHTVLGPPGPAAAAQQRFDAAVRNAAPATAPYRLDPLDQTSVGEQLQAGRLTLQFASAEVFADPPAKAAELRPGRTPSAAMAGLMAALGTARREVVIVSPYFVPGPVGMPMLRAAAQGGVRVMLVTNSLASTDEPLVHERYSAYRLEMLQLGVMVHEFSPQLTRRSGGFGSFGQSTPRLHAKVAVVDQQLLLVGSVNFDARSAIGNTEMGVVINSPPLVQRLSRLMRSSGLSSLYRLGLQDDGRTIEWAGTDAAGQRSVSLTEPGSSAWLRLKLWLQSQLVEERLL